jgi:hypothetical protein
MRKPGLLEFKKKRLAKLRKKNVALSRKDEYKKAWKSGDPWKGGMKADRRQFKEQDASAERLKEKKKAYRQKKGY